jgi:hypothetical protein
MVVTDQGNPENEGKVFLYKFGKKIFDKVMDVMQPQFADETPVNPFDFWGGANFKLKIRQVEGYRNYDKSEFDSSTPLYDGDDTKLEEVYNQLKSLQEIVDPSAFKTYAELQRKLYEVLGEEGIPGISTEVATELNETAEPVVDAPAPVQSSQPEVKSDTSGNEDDDALSYFAKLAQQD